MINHNFPDIHLVITIALKKEVPKEYFGTHDVPVHTLAALKSGSLKGSKSSHSGILVLITGPGLKASEEAAYWVRDNLKPLFVLNIGTCGITDRRGTTAEWLRPQYVSNEDGDRLELDMRLPIPYPEKVSTINSLLSVKKAKTNNIKDHDAVDMECFAQVKIFCKTDISFHCLKFGTDYSDLNTASDFNSNLDLFLKAIRELFNFLDSTPRITAIVPVYNREQTIQRAIDSILLQSSPPEKIIVIDDGSTDKTREILNDYEDRITCIYSPENSGPSAARNKGIKEAQTEWIAFLDSDDCWEKNKLENQLGYLRKYPFYQIIQSDEKWIRNGKRVNPCKHHRKPLGWIWGPSLERCLVSPSGVLIKKDLLEQYNNFDEEFPVCEDYDLWLKISRDHPVGLDPILSVIKYGGHKDQLSGSYPAMDRFRVKSLYRILRNEPSPAYRQKTIMVLEKKLHILINGYRKRDKIKYVRKYENILTSLSKF